jgi:hypothetical protein
MRLRTFGGSADSQSIISLVTDRRQNKSGSVLRSSMRLWCMCDPVVEHYRPDRLGLLRPELDGWKAETAATGRDGPGQIQKVPFCTITNGNP